MPQRPQRTLVSPDPPQDLFYASLLCIECFLLSLLHVTWSEESRAQEQTACFVPFFTPGILNVGFGFLWVPGKPNTIPTLRWLHGTHQSHGWSICGTNCRLRHDSNDSNDSKPERKWWPPPATDALLHTADAQDRDAHGNPKEISAKQGPWQLLEKDRWLTTIRASKFTDRGWEKGETGSLDQEECVVLTLGKVGKRRMAIGLAPEIATNDACKPLTVALFQHI